MSRTRLTIIALLSLLATALLSLAVSRGHGAYRLERQAVFFLGHSPSVGHWSELADALAIPAITVVVIGSVIVGALRGALMRVVVYAGFAAAAILINEHVVKPAVQERYYGGLSFPSGHVTAACATALAMWMALYPVLGKPVRAATFVAGTAWTFFMGVAVIGAYWHTPIDDLGSVFLSVGVVTAGGALIERKRKKTPQLPERVDRERVTAGV